MPLQRVLIIGILGLITACSSSRGTPAESSAGAAEHEQRVTDLPAMNPAATVTSAVHSYPVLPLPPGAVYREYHGPGISGNDLTEIAVEIDGRQTPFTPEAYTALFEQYGWTQSSTACERQETTPVPTMTDTAFLGGYIYGSGGDAPIVCLTKSTMVETYLTLSVYHCGVMRHQYQWDGPTTDSCRMSVEGK
jgi:hypothetical protein